MTERESTIICPHCGHTQTETMPADAYQFLYDCKGCGVLDQARQSGSGSGDFMNHMVIVLP